MGFPEFHGDGLRDALQLHRQGQVEAALAGYEAELRRDPSLHVAYYLIGRLWLEQNDLARARIYLDKAIGLKPGEAYYHGAIADLLQVNGQIDAAIDSYETALRLDGSEETAEIRLNYAATLMDQGRVDQAVIQFENVTRMRPTWAAAWNNLGNALMNQGLYGQAIEAFNRVLYLSDKIYETHANLAKLWNETGRNDLAVIHARKAIGISQNPAAAWFQLGWAEFESGHLDEAEAALRACLERAPKAAGAFALLGQIAEQRGLLQLAGEHWQKCLAIKPDHAAVLGRMATRLGRAMPADLHLRMEKMIGQPGRPDADREPLGYGLAHLYDLHGVYAKAVETLDMACAARERELVRRSLGYDQAAFEKQVLQWQARFRAIEIDREGLGRLAGIVSPRMVFIVGLPRSGTSLVEQVMATHPDVTGAGELTWIADLAAQYLQGQVIGLEQLLAVKTEYLNQLNRRGHKTAVVIDKLPDNIYYLELIKTLFPDALVLLTKRDLRDVGLSCRMTRFTSVRWNSRWENLLGRFAFYQRFLRQELGRLSNDIIEIHYEALVGNLEGAITPVFQKLQLDPPANCQAFHESRRIVRTASAGQVRQPLYQSSVGRWRNYEFAYGEWFVKLAELERVF